VRIKKLITLLVAICVMLAPVASNASVVADISVSTATTTAASHQGHNDHDDCPILSATDSDITHDSIQHDTHHGTKLSHNCCFSFVGIVPPTQLLVTDFSLGEHIWFTPVLRLTTRVEGLYRPPRQIT
jgi:hypothetical protein